ERQGGGRQHHRGDRVDRHGSRGGGSAVAVRARPRPGGVARRQRATARQRAAVVAGGSPRLSHRARERLPVGAHRGHAGRARGTAVRERRIARARGGRRLPSGRCRRGTLPPRRRAERRAVHRRRQHRRRRPHHAGVVARQPVPRRREVLGPGGRGPRVGVRRSGGPRRHPVRHHPAAVLQHRLLTVVRRLCGSFRRVAPVFTGRTGRGRMRASLWRHRDFDLLWAGQTVSRVGTEVSVLAVPLIAIQVLHASTFTVGTLTAMETLPFLLVGLPAGAWVDRLRRRRVLIVADGGRLLALASIPVASAIASVTLAHLFVVAFVTGVFTVFFDVAYQSYLPELVHRDQLVDGNAKLAASESSAHVVGPGLGGALIGAVGATTAVVADAVSYGISLVCIVAIRRPSERPVRHEHATLVADIRDGLHFVARDTRIRAVTACTATSNLFSGATMAVLLLLMTRVLGFDGTAIGIVFAVGGV